MPFHDERLPITWPVGADIGLGFDTTVLESKSGVTQAILNRDGPIAEFDISALVRSPQDRRDLFNFFMGVNGRFGRFRFRVEGFCSATGHQLISVAKPHVLAVGDGVETQFQLAYIFQFGTLSHLFRISKPDGAAARTVYLDAVAQVEGGGNDYTIDYLTGIVTFTVAPANGVIPTADFRFDLPCRFANDIMNYVRSSSNTRSVPDVRVKYDEGSD